MYEVVRIDVKSGKQLHQRVNCIILLVVGICLLNFDEKNVSFVIWGQWNNCMDSPWAKSGMKPIPHMTV